MVPQHSNGQGDLSGRCHRTISAGRRHRRQRLDYNDAPPALLDGGPNHDELRRRASRILVNAFMALAESTFCSAAFV